jgi:subfamily B ATP-binding cassette protein MsbA
LKTLSGTFSQLAQATAAADRVFDVLDAPVPVDEGLVAPPLRHALEFRDVDVSYEEGKEVLRHVRFTVPAGSKVGLLGSSGAGKTTVFSSLLGFVTPTSGEILWDKTPLHAFNLSSLRNQMAWVPQEPILFSGTIRQNLLWAQPSATEAQLWECLQRAHADTFVREKPEGLDAQVGERGALLSGGQRQRLAIARAFLKEPSVLLLDEPTSALDAHSESEVQAGLRALLANRTALVIAHRLSTTRDADLILVLEAGRVVESGTHETLLRQNGRYRALWEAQSTET